MPWLSARSRSTFAMVTTPQIDNGRRGVNRARWHTATTPKTANPKVKSNHLERCPTGICGFDEIHQPPVESLLVRASISSVPLLSRIGRSR